MKILVLGANGMAGHLITLYLRECGWEVDAVVRKKSSICDAMEIDLRDIDALAPVISSGKYDAVVNCAGLLNKTAEDFKADAIKINSLLPHALAEITKNLDTKIIHMSTDCVFSGKLGAYAENAQPDGETFYDRSKALGEINDDKNLTFRNSIVGPDTNPDGIGLFNWFMRQKSPVSGYSRAIWTGVSTPTLARAIKRAIETNLTGLYNLVNNKTISKLELLRLFNDAFRDGQIPITPSESVSVNKSLVNTRKDFDFVVPDYPEMVSEMKAWTDAHKNLYPHYNF